MQARAVATSRAGAVAKHHAMRMDQRRSKQILLQR